MSPKRQRILSSNKFEGFEQPYFRGTLRDGKVPYGEGIDQTTRLACKDRSKGCIPISTNTSKTPQIPTVSLEVPVQLSAFQTVMCTSSVHKTNEASSGFPEGEKDEINIPPGRYTRDVRMSVGTDKTSKPDPGSILCTGPDNKQQEVTIVPSAGINISGAPDINSINENFPPIGEQFGSWLHLWK